jgi:cysteine-rich repeat protein
MRRTALVLILLFCAAACGDNSSNPVEPDAGVTPDAPDDGCTVVELGAQDFQANLFGQLTGVRYGVTPNFDGELPESLIVELYDSTTFGLPPLATGTFELGTAPNDNLATCQHCVWMPVDWDTVSPLGTVFLATEGSITLTIVEDPLSPVFAGSTTEIVMREATVGEDGATTLVDGGRCVRVPAIDFDTQPTPGARCDSAEDCGNPLLEVCSPATLTCVPPECGEFSCPEGRSVCITQYGTQINGACYEACDPVDGGCPITHTCVQLAVDPDEGICLAIGDGALGEACEVEDASTACDLGLRCTDEHACTQTCAFFDADPGCQADHACSVLGTCDPVATFDDAAIGAPCDALATLAQGCGPEGDSYRGICFSYTETLTCEEACFDNLGCEPEEFCALRFTSGLGICLPDPVCGDGELGEIGETCDDGDTESNDGCSGDCQTVEYDVICAAAPALATGDTLGDTTDAWDGFQASCQFGIARAEVYAFDPPGRGRLRVTVDSETVHVASVRGTCADATTESACVDNDPFSGDDLIVQITEDVPLTVIISAQTVLEQGPYTLHTEFVPEQCGDGVVAGLEVCDDGDTDSNDGCRGDCLAIEYDVYCTAAETLTSSDTDDNTNGPRIYDASCSNSIYGSGPDHLYTWTAPSTGTAQFHLEQGDADLTLAVFDGCGDPSTMTEIDCSSVYGVEEVEATVTAGQTITVLVEGFGPDAAGPYTVTAAMLP